MVMEKIKLNKVLKVILTKMCSYVKLDINQLDIDKKDWFMDYSWSIKQEEEFKLWLMSYLKSSSKARDYIMFRNTKDIHQLKTCVNSFVLNYGWSYTDKK